MEAGERRGLRLPERLKSKRNGRAGTLATIRETGKLVMSWSPYMWLSFHPAQRKFMTQLKPTLIVALPYPAFSAPAHPSHHSLLELPCTVHWLPSILQSIRIPPLQDR
ncbi:hypothetical protein M758_6G212800 [Ceratodon purpureus]|nr:hypothetical protein M758_6G212800 [Ceratodon purpureus]